ncbi:MAG: hypothetical protein KF760_22550 [Candidatus Eremiobacteraeota bacterium]|nr:hypothetical protein [Candidatus Eremiobacteraeota bacterium]MCW5868587.1 hypothetical protein [Candidatus Eremiobacteraeota bacterium]
MRKKTALFVGTLAAALVYGCGSGSSNGGGGFLGNFNNTTTISARTLTVTEPGAVTINGETVDALEVEGFDATGTRVFGPVVVPFANSMSIPDPGEATQTLELDYLRNENFALARATVLRSKAGFALDNPTEVALEKPTTGFSIVPNGDGFNVVLTTSGDSTGGNTRARVSGKVETKNITFRGACYSPAPINFRNIDAPAIGDLFWDSTANTKNWKALWGSGFLEYDPSTKGRGDVDNMRAMGFNFIRTYCMISRQLFTINGGNYIPGPIPSPPDAFQHFTHTAFLDECWNNGENPVYVMVGIPLPATVLYKYGNASASERAYWDHIVTEVVKDVKDHPAVMGFTLFNEIDENTSAWPGVDQVNISGGVADANSDYYYGTLQNYAKIIHDLTGRDANNRKLVGWAAHESRPFAHYGSTVPAGNPYFTQLADIDFYGVNVYQGTNFNDTLSRTQEGALGKLTGSNRKPIIMTEVGWAASGHDSNDLIYEDAETRRLAADAITRMIPQLTVDPLVIGIAYFEYSDEWWKQPPYLATEWNGIGPVGGAPIDSAMPNRYHDQEAFGLFSTRLGAGRTSPSQDPYQNNRPVTPVDPYIERSELTRALIDAYKTHLR